MTDKQRLAGSPDSVTVTDWRPNNGFNNADAGADLRKLFEAHRPEEPGGDVLSVWTGAGAQRQCGYGPP